MPSDLARLAEIHGVATTYRTHFGQQVSPSEDTLRAVLAALGVPAEDDDAVRASLADAEQEDGRHLVPPVVVARTDREFEVPLRLSADAQPAALVRLEGGGSLPVDADPWRVGVPAGLPTGDHRLVVSVDGEPVADTPLIVAPGRCRVPGYGWGWMLQLYAARSSASWGIGDLADLATLARWSGPAGADLLLINPLHAAAPGLPQNPSPYSPSSRRFANPLYLSVEGLPELTGLPPDDTAKAAVLAASAKALNAVDRIDRDAAYEAKIAVLELAYRVPPSPERAAARAAFEAREGTALRDFATYCALAERHGPAWREWPAGLSRPDGHAVEQARRELADRIAFHAWLQWLLDDQLEAAQAAARDAGMALGVVADLAVGVSPDGADAWAMQDDLGLDVTIGAPPDDLGPQGQDWDLPPLLPNRLTETAYAPFRRLVRATLRHAGGIRVDHILGLFRLWWIPRGAAPTQGTYVRYPADDLLGVLALEAERAGAVVIGEDLGTVPTGVREAMADRGLLGNRVVWFEYAWDRRAHPDEYAELALTSVTTHDLPTAAGFWTGEAGELRIGLGLLGEAVSADDERARGAEARASLAALLRDEGLIGDDPTLGELVIALQRLAARTRSRLVAVPLADAVADPRQPNVPGTIDEYPNWRLPIADGTRPVPLEELLADPRTARLAAAVREERDRRAAAG